MPEDELGNGYEYLIKQFADDSGHTAQEFYTNRTLVHLMAQMLEPQAGESIYDPTCGTGGMLISALAEVKRARRRAPHPAPLRAGAQPDDRRHRPHEPGAARRRGLRHRSAATRWPTRPSPTATACAPSTWCSPIRRTRSRSGTARPGQSDPWGRNFLGTPPQGRADYAFFQHILKSMDPETGRCAILFPHGVLFRKEEAEMRRKLVEADLVECVLGLGPNLFFNSPMEACVVFCRSTKAAERRGRILFIDAVHEIARERAYSFLKPEHQERILGAYERYADEAGFAKVVTRR